MESILAQVANKLAEKVYDEKTGTVSAQAFCDYLDNALIAASREAVLRGWPIWNDLLAIPKDKDYWDTFEDCLLKLGEMERSEVTRSFIAKVAEDDSELGG